MAGKIFKLLANNYHWLLAAHNPGETFLIFGNWLDLDAIKLRPYLVNPELGPIMSTRIPKNAYLPTCGQPKQILQLSRIVTLELRSSVNKFDPPPSQAILLGTCMLDKLNEFIQRLQTKADIFFKQMLHRCFNLCRGISCER